MAILVPLAPYRIIVFEGEAKGVNLGMTAGAALEFLMLENGFADGGGAADVRLVDQHVGAGGSISFVVEILENPCAPVDRRRGEIGGGELEETGLGHESAALATLRRQLDGHEGIPLDGGQSVEAGQAVVGHDESPSR